MGKFKTMSLILCILILVLLLSSCATSHSQENKTPNVTTNSTTNSNTNNTQNVTNINGKLTVHFLDVGQADSILIQSPSGKTMLIGAGNNADGKNVVEYIKSKGINKIDILVATHPHEDHIGGMDDVIKAFEIGRIYMSKVSSNTKTFEDVLTAIKNKNLTVSTARVGVIIDFDSEILVNIIAPNFEKYKDLNDYSAVIKLVYKNNSFLFMGDAETISENEIINSGYELKSDVLKIGHHGSTSSTSVKFIKAVSPKFSIISVGKDNDYNHPADVTIKKLKDAGIKIFRTDELGTIIATSYGDGIDIVSEVKEGEN